MDNERKKMLIAVGASFAAGIAVTLTVFSLSCCLEKNHRPHPFPPMEATRPLSPRPSVDAMHHGNERPNMRPDFHHPERAMKDRFAEKLKLTEEQKVQIEQFRQDDMQKMEPLFKQMDELRQQADNLREANKARFESILTPEQKEILKTMRPQHDRLPQMQENGAPLPPPPAVKGINKHPKNGFAEPADAKLPSPDRQLPAPATTE